jgi:predicted tellurium resistance membrane protein TerC
LGNHRRKRHAKAASAHPKAKHLVAALVEGIPILVVAAGTIIIAIGLTMEVITEREWSMIPGVMFVIGIGGFLFYRLVQVGLDELNKSQPARAGKRQPVPRK